MRVQTIDGDLYVHAGDVCAFLVDSAQTVEALCSDAAPASTKAVVDTLNVTHQFFVDLMTSMGEQS